MKLNELRHRYRKGRPKRRPRPSPRAWIAEEAKKGRPLNVAEATRAAEQLSAAFGITKDHASGILARVVNGLERDKGGKEYVTAAELEATTEGLILTSSPRPDSRRGRRKADLETLKRARADRRESRKTRRTRATFPGLRHPSKAAEELLLAADGRWTRSSTDAATAVLTLDLWPRKAMLESLRELNRKYRPRPLGRIVSRTVEDTIATLAIRHLVKLAGLRLAAPTTMTRVAGIRAEEHPRHPERGHIQLTYTGSPKQVAEAAHALKVLQGRKALDDLTSTPAE